MPSLTRRQLMAVLIGGGAVAALAGVGLFAGREAGLIDSIIHRVVGSYQMNEKQFAAFVADLDTPRGSAAHAKFALYRAFAATEPDTLLRVTPTEMHEGYSSYERRVVTNFLTRTDWLTVGPVGQVSFIGEPSCRNPFAKFTYLDEACLTALPSRLAPALERLTPQDQMRRASCDVHNLQNG